MIVIDVTIWNDKHSKKLYYKVINKQIKKEVYNRYVDWLKKKYDTNQVFATTTDNPRGLNSEQSWVNKVNEINERNLSQIDELKKKLIPIS